MQMLTPFLRALHTGRGKDEIQPAAQGATGHRSWIVREASGIFHRPSLSNAQGKRVGVHCFMNWE